MSFIIDVLNEIGEATELEFIKVRYVIGMDDVCIMFFKNSPEIEVLIIGCSLIFFIRIPPKDKNFKEFISNHSFIEYGYERFMANKTLFEVEINLTHPNSVKGAADTIKYLLT